MQSTWTNIQTKAGGKQHVIRCVGDMTYMCGVDVCFVTLDWVDVMRKR